MATSYGLWLNVGPRDIHSRREIISSMFGLFAESPVDHPVQVLDFSTPEATTIRDSAGQKVYLDNGVPAFKAEVTLSASKSSALTGLEDGILVKVEGDYKDRVLLEVSNDLVEYDNPEGLWIQWDQPARLSVRVLDPWVVCDSSLTLTFTEPVADEEEEGS